MYNWHLRGDFFQEVRNMNVYTFIVIEKYNFFMLEISVKLTDKKNKNI